MRHAEARVPFASSRNSESIPPSFIACVTRGMPDFCSPDFHHTSIFTPAPHKRRSAGVPWRCWWLAARSSMSRKYIWKEGGARRRAQCGSGLPPASRLLAGARRLARRQKGGSCSEAAAEGGSGGKGRSGSKHAEAARCSPSWTRGSHDLGRRGSERSRPNSRAVTINSRARAQ